MHFARTVKHSLFLRILVYTGLESLHHPYAICSWKSHFRLENVCGGYVGGKVSSNLYDHQVKNDVGNWSRSSVGLREGQAIDVARTDFTYLTFGLADYYRARFIDGNYGWVSRKQPQISGLVKVKIGMKLQHSAAECVCLFTRGPINAR